MLSRIAALPHQRGAWALLAASSFILVAVALYFQYQMELEPCVKCIYQRVAVLAIGLVALIPLVAPSSAVARSLGFAGWLVAAGWGYLIAADHSAMQQAANAFFSVCDGVPAFPDFMPLHEWFPGLFEARGLCGDINWEFMSLSMPEWLQIIFASYFVTALLVLVCRLACYRKL
ncbi:disulfide bond formation protein DsbB [Pseudidiomarina sp.]|uniref:disulfide bond formation protein DsbB n=1 Tax=Pseudidiomarina sp. TaxID=2081707 RepID=UPI00299EEDD1|nr:disulfide bond formation protein DsbB [Pseudidiomarina sp.]MDX1705167.1 disulfide bond formation protein DsbB [Pseudidiomarina sp.]